MSSNDKKLSKEHPRNLIPELCQQFYHLGWVTGTGGGISIKHEDKIYIAPSGVQKERINPDDIFVQDINGKDLELPPAEKKLKKSQCTPLFMCAYLRRNASAVIHTHSKVALMVTLLWPGKEFRVTHLEMIKGIRNQKLGRAYRYDEELVVPIIENTPFEEDLREELDKAIIEYPETCAVLVRRHGVYVWGDTWQQAKTMTECYDYLFDVAIQMKQCGLNPIATPAEYELHYQTNELKIS
ncbi:probable methylthioribulose-1-phosphate dehydratase [Vespa mandarinia]|uniref:probable methylthioribulose-1-phosphate dehydratase n=1 Tax=Vespa mandarinia TaxID=7446 RepID=UPI00161C5EF4|nr:probable methylthioribulose-1-phosphate dehydratase [Vespa mandarinia]XP_035725813.1 probable methylthioribulose-1-phosphate dehydratase [Vespa mandarinia]XP_046821892.1 probable methylthioribulose-1-phosphate dehydratase [Vespa crabro]XP_046821893.1 probable methylthioribulose-1-phosphate dehydratase [Vespa crabro]XP_046821894.1 probable methylthioribulose-1-phosphate dehydratase [Vespa crabro]XP_047349902.1 probable methylthioribulose-1-phosphate dehydratase [Vespa velutina]XP_047349903.